MDYAKQDDSMTLTMNPAMNLMTAIRVSSSLENKPVSFSVDFQSLADGVSYPATTDLKWEAEKLEIRVTNLDYHK